MASEGAAAVAMIQAIKPTSGANDPLIVLVEEGLFSKNYQLGSRRLTNSDDHSNWR